MAPTLYDEKPNPGDLIEVDRGSYQHWAVYIGNGFVVHLAPPSEVAGAGANSIGSVMAEKAIVRKDELWDVVGTDKWSINNSLDEKYTPRPAKDIVREAQSRVGQEVPYCVFRKNCEHFVNELRYGQAESRQVKRAGETVMYAGMAAAIGLGVVALAGAFFGRNKEEKENNKQ